MPKLGKSKLFLGTLRRTSFAVEGRRFFFPSSSLCLSLILFLLPLRVNQVESFDRLRSSNLISRNHSSSVVRFPSVRSCEPPLSCRLEGNNGNLGIGAIKNSSNEQRNHITLKILCCRCFSLTFLAPLISFQQPSSQSLAQHSVASP